MDILFEKGGNRKVLKMGFAWDVLFLNGLVAFPLMRRGLWGSVFGWWLILGLIAWFFPVGFIGAWFTSGVVNAFSANKEHAQKLYSQGWRLVGDENAIANQIAMTKLELTACSPSALGTTLADL